MINPLMSYIGSTFTAQSSGPRKYVGDVATGYNAKRQSSHKWKKEQKIIEAIIDEFSEGSKVLDVPVGTGRFISAYERNNLEFYGADVSPDMIKEAQKNVTNNDNAQFRICSVTELDKAFDQNTFDLSIMCRLTRWLSPEERTQAMAQLKRVTKSAIVFTARVADHPYAYSYADIKRDLGSDWVIESDWSADGLNYSVIKAVPVDAVV